MATRGGKSILFLDTDGRGRIAQALFAATAGRIGLPWRPVARRIEGTAATALSASLLKAVRSHGLNALDLGVEASAVSEDDFAMAEWAIAFGEAEFRPLIERRFPMSADKVEFWETGSGSEDVTAIERQVAGFVARLLGGRTGEDIPEEKSESASSKPSKGTTVRVGRETKGRKGKGMTIVSDLPLEPAALAELATRLKGLCGSGGTVKDGRIEVQGDHRDKVAAELERVGYRVKRIGG